MKRAWFLTIGVVVLLSVSTVYAVRLNDQPVAPTRQSLLALINEERAKYGVAPLKEDVRLDTSAQLKADDEVLYKYSGHINPNTQKHGYEYIEPTGIECTASGENLSWNTDGSMLTAQDAVKWWVQSKPHHAAMIDPKFTLTGFGVNGNEIVEHFCAQ